MYLTLKPKYDRKFDVSYIPNKKIFATCINIPLGSISKVVIILLIKSEIGQGILA